MQLADTHCHLDFSQFDQLRSRLLSECQASSIELIVVPGVKRSGWGAILELAREFGTVRPALGLHPYFVSDHEASHLDDLASSLARLGSEVCAVGEIGLDATIGDIDRQIFFFEQQLGIAQQFQRPVIIHSRKKHSQIVRALKSYRLPGGVVHAFSGSLEEAESLISVGLVIGVGSVITWPRASKTRNAISQLPLASLVLETDSPDMPVCGQAKGGATPLNVLRVFDSLCEIRTETPDHLAATLWENSQRLFCDQGL